MPRRLPGIGLPLQRESRQLQPGNPPLGPRLQRRHLLRGERQPQPLLQKDAGLLLREAERRQAQLHSAPRVPAGRASGSGRILPGCEHQMQPGRQMLQEKGERRSTTELAARW